jgi:hypothetical protein
MGIGSPCPKLDKAGLTVSSIGLSGTCVVVFRKAVIVSCEEAGQTVLAWDGAAFSPVPG